MPRDNDVRPKNAAPPRPPSLLPQEPPTACTSGNARGSNPLKRSGESLRLTRSVPVNSAMRSIAMSLIPPAQTRADARTNHSNS